MKLRAGRIYKSGESIHLELIHVVGMEFLSLLRLFYTKLYSFEFQNQLILAMIPKMMAQVGATN